MAPKRRVVAGSTNSRKRARVDASEKLVDAPRTKTTRSSRTSNRIASNVTRVAKSGQDSKTPNQEATLAAEPKANTKSTGKAHSSTRGKSRAALSEDEKKGPQDAEKDESPADLDSTDERNNHKQYWLMKAEPEDRFENGYNVKFSIDDLEAASEPEPWDGVRNYVARNNMRAMKKGDLAFFYHSNCKVPGIVGIMRIVQEHTVDESAFDPKHPYYDQKSQRDKPRWDLVHVGFVKKFDEKISLKDIQNNSSTTKELSEMDLLKYKRLSVTAVKPHEWNFIVAWAGEPATIGESTK